MIEKKLIDNLPSEVGVYLFKKNDLVLYVGKSVNIKARVKSHIENAKLDKKESLIINNSDIVDYIKTDNEFNSLILESQLIKKYHPKYNVIWKDGKNYLYIKVTVKDEFPKILLSRIGYDGKSKYFGPFSSVKVTESLINDIRHIIPFCTKDKLSNTPCFYSKIDLCSPCPNFINHLKNVEERRNLKKLYRKNIRKVIGMLNGNVIKILNSYYRMLKDFSKQQDYEEAIKIRNKIYRLERLINHPISDNLNLEFLNNKQKNLDVFLKELVKYFPELVKLSRIEAYDISNLKESNQTGSMVVLTNGQLDKKEYKRFRIKNLRLKSDFGRMKEIIDRRFKNNWPKPNLIIVDGGKPQVRVVISTLRTQDITIPVLGIAKNPDRLVIGTVGLPTIRFPQTNPAFNLIRLIRDESHRFAKKYHLFLRTRDFLV